MSSEAREWCTVRELVTRGRAHWEILRVAAETDASLIVMGSHGHGPFGQVIFGSTSHQVVRSANCPVLTVRRLAPERKADVVGAQASPERLQDLQRKA